MTGLRTCPDCDGEGITECSACSNYNRFSSRKLPYGCMVCGNTHDVPCPTCNGTGYQGFSLKASTPNQTETENHGT